MTIVYEPIGIAHTPFTEPDDMPIQPAGAAGVVGRVEIFKDYEAGLKDLDGFSHLLLLYHFHRSRGFDLHVVPFLDKTPRGVFATRAPRRPNAIGLSVVKLLRIEGCNLHIQGVDLLDQTPVLDIKPHVPSFNMQGRIRIGWLAGAHRKAVRKRSDRRFQKQEVNDDNQTDSGR
jgi:tRNA-Thr(GGU) m(6)t(6)A37 methyltransferase TsaA